MDMYLVIYFGLTKTTHKYYAKLFPNLNLLLSLTLKNFYLYLRGYEFVEDQFLSVLV